MKSHVVVQGVVLQLFAFVAAGQPVDVFPLAVGNQWMYSYSVEYVDALSEFCSTDTGRVTLTVTTLSEALDSVEWTVSQIRDLVRVDRPLCGPPSSPVQICDTTLFQLVEQLSGGHHVYRSQPWGETFRDVIPFSRVHIDTTPILRYRTVGGGDTVRFYSTPAGSNRCYFTFQKNIGMRRYESRGPAITGAIYTIDHRLVEALIVGVQDEPPYERPSAFTLLQNYPNPFNPSTAISYQLRELESVRSPRPRGSNASE